ncbi:MAG: T9SS type A sorting domain-containing protein [Saprospiraceae bacterium]|nr:T9SS type A sorting domain-containing protein [Saprospiraceae bacterium]
MKYTNRLLSLCWCLTLCVGVAAQDVSGIYWTDFTHQTVKKIELDGSNETLLDHALVYPARLAIHPGTGKLYWTDTFLKKIVRANTDGSDSEIIFSDGVAEPSAFAIDTNNDKLYWINSYNNKLYRSALDGTNVEEIYAAPRAFELDLTNNKIYGITSGLLRISDLDGSNQQYITLAIGRSRQGIALDIPNGKIYMANYTDGKIERIDLDGTNLTDIVTGLVLPADVAIDQTNDKLYWIESGSNRMQRSNLDGSSVETLLSTPFDVRCGIFLDVPNNKLYWTTGDSKVQCSDLEGNNINTLDDGTAGFSTVIADKINDKLYTSNGSKIYRSGLQGENPTEILSGLSNCFDLALSLNTNKLYWGEQSQVLRANLDGSNIEPLITSGLSTNSQRSIAIDIANDKLYFVDDSKIKRANLDGSNVLELISSGINPSQLTLDLYNGKIYWTDRSGKIMRANLDGSSAETYFSNGISSFPGDITIALPSVPSNWSNGGNGNWESSGNWSSTNAPTANTEVSIDGNVTVTLSGDAEVLSLELANNAHLIINGNLNVPDVNDIVIPSSCKISGSGTINGDIQLNQGNICLGNSPGRLSIEGDFEHADGTIDVEINGTTVASLYDQLAASGALTIGANARLNIIFGGGFSPTAMDEFDIITAASITGTYDLANITFSGGNVESIALSYPGGNTVRLSATPSAPLPVSWLDFRVQEKGNQHLLAWQTATESNNAGFQVQRSADSKNWENLAWVAGAGSTFLPQQYQYLAKDPIGGINYYRLKQIDFDETYEYSKIVSINSKQAPKTFSIFPNPSSGQIQVIGVQGQLRLYSIQGKLLRTFKLTEGQQRLSLIAIPKGTYLLESVQLNGQRSIQKLIKQ